jgi:hypothetical protein
MDDHVQEYLVVYQLLLELPHLRLQGLDLPDATKLFSISLLIRLSPYLFRLIEPIWPWLFLSINLSRS